MTLADQAARDRIVGDLDSTLVIEAAAGTGKTTALTRRIVALIKSGRTTLEHVVAVTFTDKAGGELKLRLREEIERARLAEGVAPEVRGRLEKALGDLELARIGTIHAFCGDVLHERPVEARVDPRFEVAAREVADGLLARAFDRWFEESLAAPGEGVRRILSRRDYDENMGPREILRRAARELCEWRDFPAPWRRDEFNREAAIDALMGGFEELGALTPPGEPHDYLARSLQEIQRFALEAKRLEAVRERGRDYDVLEAGLCDLLRPRRGGIWRWMGRRNQKLGELTRDQVIERRNALHQRLERFRIDAQADLAAILRAELWPVIERYQQLKLQAGVLDFMDLLLTTRDLIRGDETVRSELQERFSHIFIDEFQDTDPLQAEILMLLAADDPLVSDWRMVRPRPGKLFIVGDPKQSIYRFRRADVALYQETKQRLLAAGAALEHLTVSFRATPRLQHFVNAAFGPLMVESPTQAAYAPLNQWRAGDDSQPAIIALPVPAPYSDWSDRAQITRRQIDLSLPDAVGALVDWLVRHSGWQVTERDNDGAPRPVASRHICILFRRFNAFRKDVTRDYVRALEARHIPHVLVGGSSFHEREEVMAIRSALTAIEWPDAQLAVFATLRGPIFALSDSSLLAFRHHAGTLHPFRRVPDDLPEALGEVARALGVLRDLHRGRNRCAIADTIARLLAATRAHAGFAMWPTGEQALANIARVMDEARRYESHGAVTSFRGFVDYLEDKAENGEAGEAPVVEEGTEGVRLMTVHGAKGLEFPVVILADITRNETASEAQRFVDPACGLSAFRLAGCAPRELLDHNDDELRRDAEEAARVIYVATTRARDLLVVPVIGEQPWDGWLGKLNDVLYPDVKQRRTPLDVHPAGCPQFGDDSVATRPPLAPGKAATVAPGLYQPARGDHRVVWWDPNVLRLDVAETMGLRQSRLLEVDESGQISRRGIEEHSAWSERRTTMIAAGIAPSMRVAAATELAVARPGLAADLLAHLEIEEVARDSSRPHGPRFGTLLHAVMLAAPFAADSDALARIAAYQGRMLGVVADEINAAALAAERALASRVMKLAAAATECRRESSVIVRLEDGTLVEGIADLVFAEPDGAARKWTVVDFKTDIEIAGRLNEYRAQLALYIRGVMASTGEQARGVLLWT